jgi:ABC-type sulfate/molybdate transport systems ATPase subunit
MALVLVTHSEEAARICQRVVTMRDGVLEEVGREYPRARLPRCLPPWWGCC